MNISKSKYNKTEGMCVLPEQTYADPAALGESTETKPLFAVDVRQHKGEILPHLTLGDPERG